MVAARSALIVVQAAAKGGVVSGAGGALAALAVALSTEARNENVPAARAALMCVAAGCRAVAMASAGAPFLANRPPLDPASITVGILRRAISTAATMLRIEGVVSDLMKNWRDSLDKGLRHDEVSLMIYNISRATELRMTDGTGALTVPGLMLEVRDVVHAYGPVIALDHVSISARRGEFLTILGESGSGKTTLLRVISGLERAMSVAALRINNEEVADGRRHCATVSRSSRITRCSRICPSRKTLLTG